MDRDIQKNIIHRFRRIEGQVRGLERLMESKAPCIDILTQVSAVTAAVKRAGTAVVRVYLEQCLLESSGKTEAERKRRMEEFQKSLSRYIDMA